MKRHFLTALFALIALMFVAFSVDPGNKTVTTCIFIGFAVLATIAAFYVEFELKD